MKEYFLKPGFIFFAVEPTTILTVLGSCAAVTIYDRSRRQGGMNHFVHPQLGSGDSPTAVFARPAILQLVRLFNQSGSDFSALEAQVFGGAAHPEAIGLQKEIGQNNVNEAREILSRYGIKIAGEDVGGRQGRKIIFNTETGEVVIAKVDKIRSEDWYPQDGDW
jgi:chemotaxis protein CheD